MVNAVNVGNEMMVHATFTPDDVNDTVDGHNNRCATGNTRGNRRYDREYGGRGCG